MKIVVGVLLIVAVLALAAMAGTVMVRDPGLVMLSYGGHQITTGLWTFLLVAVLAFLAIRFLFSTLASLLSSRQIFGRWTAKRRRSSAKRQTEQGLLLMAEEEWSDARKSLVGGAKGASTPLLNYLQAAYASNELGQIKRRDDLLAKAAKETPDAQFALDLAAARMQIAGDDSELDAGLEKLLKLRDQAPRHQIVAEFIARAYEKKADFSALESQLADVKRMRKEHPEDVARMETAIARHKILGAFEKDGDGPGALGAWKRASKDVRLDSALVTEVATTLASGNALQQAGELLADALSDQWNAAWLSQFVNLPGIEDEQAKQANSWLKSHAKDAQVQLLAARSEAAKENWTKAQSYAQRSEELTPSAAARIELARAELALNQSGSADSSADASNKDDKEKPEQAA